MLVIKANDLWGVADSRFNTFETVRANPGEFNVSIDVTVLANEIPDTFDMTPIGGNPVGPYHRLGFISGHGGLFDEGPPDLLQGPASLLFSNGDADGDMLPNFSDPQYVDPGNTPGLPGVGVPGVIQRRYVFPASAMSFPAAPLAGAARRGGNRDAAGGSTRRLHARLRLQRQLAIDHSYYGGRRRRRYFRRPRQFFSSTPASFIIDNMRFLPAIRSPVPTSIAAAR